ncbi:hypothetical protein SAMN05216315_10551 [Nitrosospira sp. Nsp18]|uniref:hypothetical protein n=1 Tax=Nitrosospira sp. Nsp18 TaxID=1855334 RepID=UPI00087ED8B1|nr:hypothetical protein [Nitrosospira sp. Nsp18]SDA14485.1 hypothetical protein SAMN05216315_10551 [Nitrosospira sp. Nsp18]
MGNISLSGKRAKWLIAIALIVLLPGCQTADTRRTGGLIGSIAGSIGASYLGGGTVGRILGAVAGGVAGYYVGSEIGGVLGKDDKKKMADASQKAFETNQTQTFSNPDSGLVDKAEVVQSGPVTAQQNKECKTIRQTVVLKDGKTVTEDVNSCKD